MQFDLFSSDMDNGDMLVPCINSHAFKAVLQIRIRIQIRRIHMDPDPLDRGMEPDPDPSIFKQK